MNLVPILDHLAVFIFAVTGALSASRAQLDVVGFLFLAALTAVGGGTVRDVILNREPVFWVADPGFILLACAAAVGVFFTAHLLESRYRAILWFDACALAVAVPAGVGVAMSMEQSWGIVLIMGVVTGTLGGLMRDVVCNEVPLVLRQGELYVTAALAGAVTGVVVAHLTGSSGLGLLACGAATLALRAGSLALGWKLPVYRSRSPHS